MMALMIGRRGPDVERWQHFLAKHQLLAEPAIGTFDEITDRATRTFQTREGLKADGIVGKITLKRAQELGMEVFRRVRDSEVVPALTEEAKRILKAHYHAPYGSEFPFEHGGRRYFGRIEQHYHPPGGALKPWGYHSGVSLFVQTDVAQTESVFQDAPQVG